MCNASKYLTSQQATLYTIDLYAIMAATCIDLFLFCLNMRKIQLILRIYHLRKQIGSAHGGGTVLLFYAAHNKLFVQHIQELRIRAFLFYFFSFLVNQIAYMAHIKLHWIVK